MAMDDVIRVDVAWATAPYATPTWVEVTNISDAELAKRGVRGLSWEYGRNGPMSMWSASRLQMEVNNRDGDWDASSLASSTFGSANIQKNKRIRVRVSDDGFSTSRTDFHGFIDDIQPAGTNLESLASVTASDGMRVLAEVDLDDEVRAEEWAGDRIAALLTAAGIPAGLVSTIENGTVRMPAETYSTSALSAIQQCVRADMGFFWWDHDAGQFEYRERYATGEVTNWFTRTHSFNEAGSATVSKIRMRPTRRTLGSFNKVSRVTASSTGGTDRTYEYDVTGANEIKSTATRDTHQLDIAYDAMVEYSPRHAHDALAFSDERLEEIEVLVYPGNDGALDGVAAGDWQPITRVEVQHTPLGFSSDLNFEAHIESVHHRADAEQWVATLRLSPYFTDLRDNIASFFYNYGDTLGANDLGGT